jgi:coproporphyrinogen III oxidase
MVYSDMENKKQIASAWFSEIRDRICAAFEKLERDFGSNAKFERTGWERSVGGGGIISKMHGEVFEKVGVNVSTVWGKFSDRFAKEIPGCDEDTSFWASGVSLVAHMKSPLVPAVHMNTRMIVTSKAWFGGGADLTPVFPIDEDTKHFHGTLKAACDKFSPDYYPRFKKECDDYFYIAHRKEPRGVGGIFYDYLNTGDWEQDFGFTQEVGKAFIESYVPLVAKHMHEKWDQDQKMQQLVKRGRYVEFNLVYDRGTRFGLMTDGNPEAILMSMPPEVIWK